MSQDPASFDGIFPSGFSGANGPSPNASTPDGGEESGTDIDTLLQAVDELPYGSQGLAVLDDALRVARDNGLEEDEYRIRMRLVAFAEMGGDVDGVLSNFTWCVSHNEADPVRFPTQTDHCDLLWYYKWIPGTLATNPEFSRIDVLDALANMEQRYRRDGIGMSAVYQARFAEASQAGFDQEAEHWRELLATTERDDYSHCEACTRAELVSYYLGLGDDERALQYFDEIVEGQLTCGEEPESVMAHVMLPLLRAGRTDDAVQAHRLSYRLARENPTLTSVLMQHAEFAAVTGNHARALTLVERHLPWLAHDTLNESAHFAILTPLAVTCQILADAGHGELPVRGSGDADVRIVLDVSAEPGGEKIPGGEAVAGTADPARPGAAAEAADTEHGRAPEPLTVAELAAASWAVGRRIGQAFDRRNDTDRYARRLAEAREDARLSYDVPLGSPEQFPATPAAQPAAADVDGWIDRATWGLVAGDPQRVRDAVAKGLAANPTPRQALLLWGAMADLAADVAHAAQDEEDSDEGSHPDQQLDADLANALAQRAQLYRDLGLDEEADFELADGRLMYDYLDDDDAQHTADLLATVESPEVRARLMYVVANFARARGNREAAGEGFAKAAQQAQLAGDHHTYVRSLIGQCWTAEIDAEDPEPARELFAAARAAGPRANQEYDLAYLAALDALLVDRDPQAALQHARRAADLALANRAPGPMHQVTAFRADLLVNLERFREAATAQHVYLQLLDDLGSGIDLEAVVAETRALLLADQPEEALEAIDAVARLLDENPDAAGPGERAVAQYWRGMAAEAVGAFQLAFAYWLSALEIGESAWEAMPGHPDAQRAALHGSLAVRKLTTLAARAEEPDDVRNLGRRALALAAALEPYDATFVPITQQDVGRAFVEIGDAEPGLELLQAAEEGHQQLDATWFAADARDVHGRALAALDRPDEAIPMLLSAADGYRGAEDSTNAALSEFAAAVILRAHDKQEEAAVLLDGALEAVAAEPSEARTAIATIYAELLAEQGKPAEAQRVRGYIE